MDSPQIFTQEEEEFLDKHWPTKHQLEIAIENFIVVFDPQHKMGRKMLYDFIASGTLEYGRVTLQAFVQNTSDKILKNVDQYEAHHTIMLVCDYFNSQHHVNQQQLLSKRIFDTLCAPIPLYKNAAFVQCWGDIVEQALQYKEHQLECRKNNFDAFEFPFNMQIVHDF